MIPLTVASMSRKVSTSQPAGSQLSLVTPPLGLSNRYNYFIGQRRPHNRRVDSGTSKAEISDMYVQSSDLEGKPLQEDLITKEAAGKSVHVLGQGMHMTITLWRAALLIQLSVLADGCAVAEYAHALPAVLPNWGDRYTCTLPNLDILLETGTIAIH